MIASLWIVWVTTYLVIVGSLLFKVTLHGLSDRVKVMKINRKLLEVLEPGFSLRLSLALRFLNV